jgi:hypothetical protein
MPSAKRRLQASSSPVGIGHSSLTAEQSLAPPPLPPPPPPLPLPPAPLPLLLLLPLLPAT